MTAAAAPGAPVSSVGSLMHLLRDHRSDFASAQVCTVGTGGVSFVSGDEPGRARGRPTGPQTLRRSTTAAKRGLSAAWPGDTTKDSGRQRRSVYRCVLNIYRLIRDYLHHNACTIRRYAFPPDSFWTAAPDLAARTADLEALAEAVDRQGRYRIGQTCTSGPQTSGAGVHLIRLARLRKQARRRRSRETVEATRARG